MKIWDEFIASRGSDWSAASPDSSHDSENQPQTSDELPVQEYSQTVAKTDEYPTNPAVNSEESAQIEDKFNAASSGNVALPCGCPYHDATQANTAEEVKPSCSCTHSETKPLVSQEPIKQSAQFSTPLVQSPVLAPVESVHPSCGCLHASHPTLSQEPILVPVPPLTPQLAVETPVKPACGCSHHAPAQQTPQHIQQNPQNVQHTPQSIKQTPQNIQCGCATNAPTNGQTLPSQPAQAVNHETQPQQNCNQRANPQQKTPNTAISSFSQQNQPVPSNPQQISPIPAISQQKIPILTRPCVKRPIFGPLEHFKRSYSQTQNSNPLILHHVSSSAPVQSIPRVSAANSASQYCECSNVTPSKNSGDSSCNQAQKQSEKTAINSQYLSCACQNSQNQVHPKPVQYSQRYQPMGQHHTATNQKAPCRCSSCTKAYDWSNHSNGRKPLDWVKHLPF